MAILGAHQSIAGGCDRAVERARTVGCDCVQLFTKNNNQWTAKPLTPEAAARFAAALVRHQITHPIAHDSYLINLASPDRQLWKRSIDALLEELCRADALGIPLVVAHPGSFTTGTPEGGLRRVARALDEIHAQGRGLRARCLLETTAGQGTSLGWRFEQLAAILSMVREPDRLGVCFDTCHVFAAGYPLGTEKEYRATMRAVEQTIGLERIEAIHLNDSRRELGARVDRHEHIGRGQLGTESFRRLLADPRFQEVPMYLETPKGEEGGVDLDRINLQRLRGLVAPVVRQARRGFRKGGKRPCQGR